MFWEGLASKVYFGGLSPRPRGLDRGVSPGEVPKALAFMSEGNKSFLNTYCVLGTRFFLTLLQLSRLCTEFQAQL